MGIESQIIMMNTKELSKLKRSIGQHIGNTPDQELRWILRDPKFRREWMSDHRIPWSASIEDYIKRRVGTSLGMWDMKVKGFIIDA